MDLSKYINNIYNSTFVVWNWLIPLLHKMEIKVDITIWWMKGSKIMKILFLTSI